MAIALLITDLNLNVVGNPLHQWTSLDVTLRLNEPASGTVEFPAYPEVMEQLQPGRRIIVIRDGEIWCAGPLEIPQDYQWGVGGGEGSGEPDPGKVTASFTDDLARIAGYITYPDPTKAADQQTTDAYKTYTSTNAEIIMRDLVNTQCGPEALEERQIEKLVLGASSGVGTNMTFQTRFQPLTQELRTIAANDNLCFRTQQVGNQIEFQVFEPEDKTATARFSKGLGNLRSFTYKQSAPTLTHAIVGGQGEGENRDIVEVSDETAATQWYRVERFVDQRNVEEDAEDQLTLSGEEALAEEAQRVELSTVTIDTPLLRAGRDFGIGDYVTIALPTGLEVAEQVRSIHLQATPNSGEFVTSVIGSAEATTSTGMVRLIRNLGQRLGRLETR